MAGKTVVLTLRVGERERDEIEALIEAKLLRVGRRKMSAAEYTREALREKMQRTKIDVKADQIVSQRDRRILEQIAALMSKMQPAMQSATAAQGGSAGLETLSLQIGKLAAGQKRLEALLNALLGDDPPLEEPQKQTPKRTGALPGAGALNQIISTARK